jgi:xanthosine utilization system XapX-like protein
MLTKIWDIILVSAEGSFIQVTVFVGAVLLLFGYVDFLQQGAFVAKIEQSKKYQPLIGALLGILPGCGGSIFLMPLYMRGTVTFGTVVATLIATAGDSAFVTLTQAPKEFLLVTFLCLIVGTVTGYIVDYFKIGDWVRKKSPLLSKNDVARKHAEAEAALDLLYEDENSTCRSCNLKHIGHVEGDAIDLALHHKKPLDTKRFGYRMAHHYYLVFWLVISVGFIVGIIELTQLDINSLPGLPNLGKILGILGTVVTVSYMAFSKRILKAQSHEDAEHKLSSIKETFAHNAQETAFVGTWVFFAYLAYEIVVHLIGGEQVVAGFMTSAGLVSVLLGVLIGIIPGCGPQVIFVSLYLRGMFPFAALLANAISQDGDALFPLIAMDRRSAFWATVLNTIPATLVGVAAYFIELRWF